MKPRDLEGKRVGIRSFTTTTGAWLRGILANDYGVNLDAINWVTFEDAHVAEFRDTTVRAPQGRQIIQMLRDGDLDAVLGEKVEGPDLKPLFANAAAEELSWFAKHGVVPINHMVVVSEALSKSLLTRCGKFSVCCSGVHRDTGRCQARFAIAADEMGRSLALIGEYCAQQGLIPRAYAVDEMFDDVTRRCNFRRDANATGTDL